METTTTTTSSSPASHDSGGSAPAHEGGASELTSETTRSAVRETIARLSGSNGHEQTDHSGAETTDESDFAAEQPGAQGERARDTRGRFARSQPGEVQPEPASEPHPLKPPQDWKGAAKEQWNKLPREIQEEAYGGYLRLQKTLSEAAQLRKQVDEWQGVLTPYEQHLAQAGISLPGPQTVAALLQEISQIDPRVLSGEAPLPEGVTHEQIEQHVATRAQEMARAMVDREQARMGVETWQEFEASGPEFLNMPGFRERVLAEYLVWGQQNPGRRANAAVLQKMYEAACQSIPGVRRVIEQRAALAERKKNGNAGPPAAAAVGIKNEPTTESRSAGPAKSTADEVRRQMARLTRGGRRV